MVESQHALGIRNGLNGASLPEIFSKQPVQDLLFEYQSLFLQVTSGQWTDARTGARVFLPAKKSPQELMPYAECRSDDDGMHISLDDSGLHDPTIFGKALVHYVEFLKFRKKFADMFYPSDERQAEKEALRGIHHTMIKHGEPHMNMKQIGEHARGACGELMFARVISSMQDRFSFDDQRGMNIIYSSQKTPEDLHIGGHHVLLNGHQVLIYDAESNQAQENDLLVMPTKGNAAYLMDTSTSAKEISSKIEEDDGLFSRFRDRAAADKKDPLLFTKFHVLLGRSASGSCDLAQEVTPREIRKVFGDLPKREGMHVVMLPIFDAVAECAEKVSQTLARKRKIVPILSGNKDEVLGMTLRDRSRMFSL